MNIQIKLLIRRKIEAFLINMYRFSSPLTALSSLKRICSHIEVMRLIPEWTQDSGVYYPEVDSKHCVSTGYTLSFQATAMHIL